jgi:hypothetical protein
MTSIYTKREGTLGTRVYFLTVFRFTNELGEKVEVVLLTRKRNNANEANREKSRLMKNQTKVAFVHCQLHQIQ